MVVGVVLVSPADTTLGRGVELVFSSSLNARFALR